jgi:hypothetical protein
MERLITYTELALHIWADSVRFSRKFFTVLHQGVELLLRQFGQQRKMVEYAPALCFRFRPQRFNDAGEGAPFLT